MIGLLAALLLAASPAEARTPRSAAARQAFVREHPCPATGVRRLPCPGHIIDHVVPLCAGGPDHPGNMQWQTVAQARLKDREERRQCRTSAR